MKTLQYAMWVAIAALSLSACGTRTEIYNGKGGQPGGGTRPGEEIVNPQQRTDWSVSYRDRTDYREGDGTLVRVEEFDANYTGSNYFIIRTLTDEDFANFYGNDVKSLIEGEVKDIATMADNQGIKVYEMNTVVFDKNVKNILFDLLIHGQYTAWLIELTAEGKPTYNYNKSTFTVREEEAIDSYLDWLGTWHISDAYSSFDISISAAENNYLYYVDGWETGTSVSYKNGDWIYARYKNLDKNLYFYAQTVGDTEDQDLKSWVTKCFVGSYLSSEAPSDGVGLIDGEGVDWQADIAHTEVDGSGNVSVKPLVIEFDNGFKTAYHSMRFSCLCWNDDLWYHYNTGGVPVFTDHSVTMLRVKSDVAPRERVRTKEMVNRMQPRRHVDKTQSMRLRKH